MLLLAMIDYCLLKIWRLQGPLADSRVLSITACAVTRARLERKRLARNARALTPIKERGRGQRTHEKKALARVLTEPYRRRGHAERAILVAPSEIN